MQEENTNIIVLYEVIRLYYNKLLSNWPELNHIGKKLRPTLLDSLCACLIMDLMQSCPDFGMCYDGIED